VELVGFGETKLRSAEVEMRGGIGGDGRVGIVGGSLLMGNSRNERQLW